MIAKYDARCGLCDEKISEGEQIEDFDDEWCHTECVEDEEDYNYEEEK